MGGRSFGPKYNLFNVVMPPLSRVADDAVLVRARTTTVREVLDVVIVVVVLLLNSTSRSRFRPWFLAAETKTKTKTMLAVACSFVQVYGGQYADLFVPGSGRDSGMEARGSTTQAWTVAWTGIRPRPRETAHERTSHRWQRPSPCTPPPCCWRLATVPQGRRDVVGDLQG